MTADEFKKLPQLKHISWRFRDPDQDEAESFKESLEPILDVYSGAKVLYAVFGDATHALIHSSPYLDYEPDTARAKIYIANQWIDRPTCIFVKADPEHSVRPREFIISDNKTGYVSGNIVIKDDQVIRTFDRNVNQ